MGVWLGRRCVSAVDTYYMYTYIYIYIFFFSGTLPCVHWFAHPVGAFGLLSFPRFSTSMIVIYAVLIMLGGVISYLYIKFPPSESPARARPHSVKKEKRLKAEANQKQSQNRLIS
jgi:hypothetical protein